MTNSLSASEIVDIAKQIERAGEAFYDEALKHLKGERIREIFAFLRNEERRHGAAFEALLARVAAVSGEWRLDEQYLAYMRALADDHVFPDPSRAREAVRRLDSDAAAIQYALGFEKDSILFLHEMRTMMREEDRPMVDHLIAEEQSHVRRLHALLGEVESEGPEEKGAR